MKKLFWSLLAIIVISGTSCQQQFDAEQEKEAILAVLQDEKDGFTNMDLEQWSRNVNQDPSYTFMAASSDQYWMSQGYEDHVDVIKEMWSGWDPDETRERIEFEVKQIRVTPQAAWVLIDVGSRKEAIFLEKTEDSWIISCHAIVMDSSYEDEEEEDHDENDDDEGHDDDEDHEGDEDEHHEGDEDNQ